MFIGMSKLLLGNKVPSNVVVIGDGKGHRRWRFDGSINKCQHSGNMCIGDLRKPFQLGEMRERERDGLHINPQLRLKRWITYHELNFHEAVK